MQESLLTIIGLIVGLVSVSFSSLGKILFKYWKDEESIWKRYAPDAIITATNVTGLFTTGVLPLSVSSIFSGLPIVLSQLISRWLLKTRMSRTQWALSVLIVGAIAGIIICQTLDKKPRDNHMKTFHKQMFKKQWPMIFFLIPFVVQTLGVYHIRKYTDEQLASSLKLAVLGSAIGSSFFVIMGIQIKVAATIIMHASDVASKAYYCVFGTIPIFALLQLCWVGYMWRKLNHVYVLPLYQSFNVINGTLSGVILFKEYPGWPVGFTMCVLALAAMNGIFLFCGRPPETSVDEISSEKTRSSTELTPHPL